MAIDAKLEFSSIMLDWWGKIGYRGSGSICRQRKIEIFVYIVSCTRVICHNCILGWGLDLRALAFKI